MARSVLLRQGAGVAQVAFPVGTGAAVVADIGRSLAACGNFLVQSLLFEFAEMQGMQLWVTADGRSGHGGLLGEFRYHHNIGGGRTHPLAHL